MRPRYDGKSVINATPRSLRTTLVMSELRCLNRGLVEEPHTRPVRQRGSMSRPHGRFVIIVSGNGLASCLRVGVGCISSAFTNPMSDESSRGKIRRV